MSKRRITYILVLSFVYHFCIGQYSITETYTTGDIPTAFDDYSSLCNSSIDVMIPAVIGTSTIEVVGVDITYNMTSVSGAAGFMSDQRSQVYCLTSNTLEDNVYTGVGDVGGTMSYSRLNVDIANGSYTTGDIITFDLRAWRVLWEGVSGCNDLVQKVDNITWTMTVHFNACPEGEGIVLETQAQVDLFVSDFGSCEYIPQDLTIQGTVTDISGLSNITSIGGKLEIWNADLLTSLNGLQGIQSIGTSLLINDNDLLTNLSGLDNLVSVSERVVVNRNNSLVNLIGLGSLSHVGLLLYVHNQSSSFTSLSGLSSLTNLVGDISIRNNPGLINASGLNNLTSVQGYVDFVENINMVDLVGLNSLTSTNGLYVLYSPSLTSLNGLQFLTDIDSSLFLSHNDILIDFSAITNLTTYPEFISIQNNSSMSNLDFLTGFTSVSTMLIWDNLLLNDITGLSNITAVDSILKIENNSSLTSLEGVENITSINELIISENPLLTDLSYLENMTISNNLWINENNGLLDLSGTTGLVCEGTIRISRNSNLLSLAGFIEDVRELDGDFILFFNTSLVDISQLSNLYILSGDLDITYNTLLSECCIINMMYPRVFNSYNIHDNNTGCETMLDIQVSCENSDPDEDGISTSNDNCPNIYNPNQEDNDSDGIGNPCDNCSIIANAGQEDANNNFIGDACEVAEPGKVGVNTESPNSGLEVSFSELYLSDTSRGLIMTNASGSCFRLFVDLNGKLQTMPIECPN